MASRKIDAKNASTDVRRFSRSLRIFFPTYLQNLRKLFVLNQIKQLRNCKFIRITISYLDLLNYIFKWQHLNSERVRGFKLVQFSYSLYFFKKNNSVITIENVTIQGIPQSLNTAYQWLSPRIGSLAAESARVRTPLRLHVRRNPLLLADGEVFSAFVPRTSLDWLKMWKDIILSGQISITLSQTFISFQVLKAAELIYLFI